jgi:hypothetical protein
MKKWVSADRPSGREELAIVLDDVHGRGPGYHPGDEEKIGMLSDLWGACEDAPLFGTILRLAAEAWQGSVVDLITQDGWHHSGSFIWGRIRRP